MLKAIENSAESTACQIRSTCIKDKNGANQLNKIQCHAAEIAFLANLCYLLLER